MFFFLLLLETSALREAALDFVSFCWFSRNRPVAGGRRSAPGAAARFSEQLTTCSDSFSLSELIIPDLSLFPHSS